jgi:hypothetical protein
MLIASSHLQMGRHLHAAEYPQAKGATQYEIERYLESLANEKAAMPQAKPSTPTLTLNAIPNTINLSPAPSPYKPRLPSPPRFEQQTQAELPGHEVLAATGTFAVRSGDQRLVVGNDVKMALVDDSGKGMTAATDYALTPSLHRAPGERPCDPLVASQPGRLAQIRLRMHRGGGVFLFVFFPCCCCCCCCCCCYCRCRCCCCCCYCCCFFFCFCCCCVLFFFTLMLLLLLLSLSLSLSLSLLLLLLFFVVMFMVIVIVIVIVIVGVIVVVGVAVVIVVGVVFVGVVVVVVVLFCCCYYFCCRCCSYTCCWCWC